MKQTAISHPTDTIPHNALVRVHGFAMLRKVEDGKTYLIKRDDERRLYWFCVPRTGREIIGHYQDEIDHGLQCFPRGDNNCLEVFAIVKPETEDEELDRLYLLSPHKMTAEQTARFQALRAKLIEPGLAIAYREERRAACSIHGEGDESSCVHDPRD